MPREGGAGAATGAGGGTAGKGEGGNGAAGTGTAGDPDGDGAAAGHGAPPEGAAGDGAPGSVSGGAGGQKEGGAEGGSAGARAGQFAPVGPGVAGAPEEGRSAGRTMSPTGGADGKIGPEPRPRLDTPAVTFRSTVGGRVGHPEGPVGERTAAFTPPGGSGGVPTPPLSPGLGRSCVGRRRRWLNPNPVAAPAARTSKPTTSHCKAPVSLGEADGPLTVAA